MASICGIDFAERPTAVLYAVFFAAIFANFYHRFVLQQNRVPEPPFVGNNALRKERPVAFFALQHNVPTVFYRKFLYHNWWYGNK
jgi:hypothetical protein